MAQLVSALHKSTYGTNYTIRDPKTEELVNRSAFDNKTSHIMDMNPELANVIKQLKDSQFRSLIYGDLFPNNIIANDEDVFLYDFTVCRNGQPTFEIGYLLGHYMLLMLKSGSHIKTTDALDSFVNEYFGQLRSSIGSKKEEFSNEVIRYLGISILYNFSRKTTKKYVEGIRNPDRIVRTAKNIITGDYTDIIKVIEKFE